ncbi:DUF421 domain-containing protein [Bacillota bacterium LX-D]|nr:DUF421 domain-containing protein [Bacillota bacterium LX-D]
MSIILVVIIRSFIAFIGLLFLVRLMNKQQVAELTFFDYVVGITVGSIAATLSVSVNQNTLATLAGMVVWALLPILLAYLCVHNLWIRKVVEGEATIVIQNGKIMENNLRRIRLTIDDLLSELRVKGIFKIEDVEFALFEANGKLSIQKTSQKSPLTPSDLGITTAYEGLPTVLIQNGVVLTDALKSLKLSQAWLLHHLAKKNILDIKNVSLAQLDTQGNIYIDLKDDQTFFTIDTQKN